MLRQSWPFYLSYECKVVRKMGITSIVWWHWLGLCWGTCSCTHYHLCNISADVKHWKGQLVCSFRYEDDHWSQAAAMSLRWHSYLLLFSVNWQPSQCWLLEPGEVLIWSYELWADLHTDGKELFGSSLAPWGHNNTSKEWQQNSKFWERKGLKNKAK